MAAVWGLSSPMASTPQCQRTAKAQHRSQKHAAAQISQGSRKGRWQNGSASQERPRTGGGGVPDGSRYGFGRGNNPESHETADSLATNSLPSSRPIGALCSLWKTNSHGIVSMLTQASTTWHQKYEGGDSRNVAEGNVVGSTPDGVAGPIVEKIEKDPQVLRWRRRRAGQCGLRSNGCATSGARSRGRRWHPAETTCSTRTQSAPWHN